LLELIDREAPSVTGLSYKDAMLLMNRLIEKWLVGQHDEEDRTQTLRKHVWNRLLRTFFRQGRTPLRRPSKKSTVFAMVREVLEARCGTDGLQGGYEGAVCHYESGATIEWSKGEVSQVLYNQLFVARGDMCGCSQAHDVATRALADEWGLNTDAFEAGPPRSQLEKARTATTKGVQGLTSIYSTTHGADAACLPFDWWYSLFDSSPELSERVVCEDRPEQLVLFFDQTFFAACTEEDCEEGCEEEEEDCEEPRAPTEHEVYAALGHRLMGETTEPLTDGAAAAFAQTKVASKSLDVPSPILRYKSYLSESKVQVPASAVVTLQPPDPNAPATPDAAAAATPDAAAQLEHIDVRQTLLSSTRTDGVSVRTLSDCAYCCNVDGFASKSKGDGTADSQMTTAFACRMITWTNNRGTAAVVPICYWPGDDNYVNGKTVFDDSGMARQMRDLCDKPRPDPLNPKKAVVHCNRNWSIDGKAAGNWGGWGGWIGDGTTTNGLDSCTRQQIISRDTATCATQLRSADMRREAAELVAWQETEGGARPASRVTKLLLADLFNGMTYFVTRVAVLERSLHRTATSLPRALTSIKAGLAALQSNTDDARAEALGDFRKAAKHLRHFKPNASPKGVNTAIGGGRPLKQLSKTLTRLYALNEQMVEHLEKTAPVAKDVRELLVAVGAAEEAAVRSKKAEYWPEDKAGMSLRWHPEGIAAAVLASVAKLESIQNELGDNGVDITEPSELSEMPPKLQKLLSQTDGTLSDMRTAMDLSSADQMFNALEKLQKAYNGRKKVWMREKPTLVGKDEKKDAYTYLGGEHSCFLPGGRYHDCAYEVPGILHCTRLRVVGGALANKGYLGTAYGLKYVSLGDSGSYKSSDASAGLNRGHLTDGATVQSCLVDMFKAELKIGCKTVPNSKGGRMSTKQTTGKSIGGMIGEITILDENGDSVMPNPVPLWTCMPPLLEDAFQSLTMLMSFLTHLVEAEEPSIQYGPEYGCEQLCALAHSARDALVLVFDAAHPAYKTDRGHTIDWFVLSAHLFLNHAATRLFCSMCEGPITLGRLIEDAFESFHVYSKGAIRDHGAPQRWSHWNEMRYALTRMVRQVLVRFKRANLFEKREEDASNLWGAQIPARQWSAEKAQVAIDYIKACSKNEDVSISEDFELVHTPGGSGCASFPLFDAGRHAAPVETLNRRSGEGDLGGEADPEGTAEGTDEDEAGDEAGGDGACDADGGAAGGGAADGGGATAGDGEGGGGAAGGGAAGDAGGAAGDAGGAAGDGEDGGDATAGGGHGPPVTFDLALTAPLVVLEAFLEVFKSGQLLPWATQVAVQMHVQDDPHDWEYQNAATLHVDVAPSAELVGQSITERIIDPCFALMLRSELRAAGRCEPDDMACQWFSATVHMPNGLTVTPHPSEAECEHEAAGMLNANAANNEAGEFMMPDADALQADANALMGQQLPEANALAASRASALTEIEKIRLTGGAKAGVALGAYENKPKALLKAVCTAVGKPKGCTDSNTRAALVQALLLACSADLRISAQELPGLTAETWATWAKGRLR